MVKEGGIGGQNSPLVCLVVMAHDLTGQLVSSEIHGFHTLQGTCILLLLPLLLDCAHFWLNLHFH